LELGGLRIVYRLKRRSAGGDSTGREKIAVESATLTLHAGEFVSLVGESGSGKTTLGLAIMGLRPIAAGHVRIEGAEYAAGRRRFRRQLARKVQFLFQDPYDSLDPRWRVERIVEEPLRIQNRFLSKHERRTAVAEALERVNLTPSKLFVSRLPTELSGGERQRVAIAAALVTKPQLLIADEPVSMVDATVRASILSLLAGLCSDGLAILMITHDLSTAALHSDRIVVMREGQIVEEGPVAQVCNTPRHPYTRTLLDAVPRLPPSRARTDA
jgi:ABC-type glutathione transport system ATPase component